MNRVQEIASRDGVVSEVESYQQRLEEIVDLAISVQQIPAPTFSERERTAYICRQFARLGLCDVEADELGNALGRYPGQGNGAPLIISAHSDTVFPRETDLAISRRDGRIFGPGIADNSLGIAGLFVLAESFQRLGFRTRRDIWFVANVAEEGLGDLMGMRAIVDRFRNQGVYIVLEGGMYGDVCHQAIGVHRSRISVLAPGGHSWQSFGVPSAVHVLGGLIAAIDGLSVPKSPRTTYNVGVVEGGTTVNTIAQRATMLLDLRSEDPLCLENLVDQVQEIVRDIGGRNERIEVAMEQIGERPAGEIGRGSALVRWAVAALKQVGCDDLEFTIGSTDANIPLSRGLPAVCIGLTQAGNTHRPDEYMEIGPLPAGLAQALLLALAAAGD